MDTNDAQFFKYSSLTINVQINNKSRGSITIKKKMIHKKISLLIYKNERMSSYLTNDYTVIKYITGEKIIIMV